MKMLSALIAAWVLLAGAPVRGADPPPRYRDLDAAGKKEVAELQGRFMQFLLDAEFEKAVQVDKQVAAYRERRQGAGHWQTRDAKLNVERNLWVLRVRFKDRAELIRGIRIETGGPSASAESALRRGGEEAARRPGRL